MISIFSLPDFRLALRRVGIKAWSIGLSVLLFGCGDQIVPPDPDDILREQFGIDTLPDTPYPSDNEYDISRIRLGRLLFFDPILSGEKDVSCGTCHHPDFAFGDGRPLSAGVSGVGLGPNRTLSVSSVTGDPIEDVPRNAPTVFNSALTTTQTGELTHLAPVFWDGRAEGLEAQALKPPTSRVEMRGDAFPGTDTEAGQDAIDSLLLRLRRISGYVTLFHEAFPQESGPLPTGDPSIITRSTYSRAIASYERELVTRNSPMDRYAAGQNDALSPQQKQGMELFFGRAKCFICHRGPMMSTFQYMRTGVPNFGPGKNVIPGDDTGREEATGRIEDRYRFRIPSLRNVELTGPYMHAGVFTTLEQVVRFYNDGARPRHPNITDDMVEVVMRQPLGLTNSEVNDLVEFLKSLTDPGVMLDAELLTVPTAVPSGLAPVNGLGVP